MKEYHYYSNREFKRFDAPQNEQIADGLLTREQILQVLRDNCERADEVYRFTVPRHILFDIANVHHPNLDVFIVDGKSGDSDPAVRCSPFDTAVLDLPHCKVYIHCHRCVPINFFDRKEP